MDRTWVVSRKIGLLLTLVALFSCGCQTVTTSEELLARSKIPRELDKTSMPDYVVEPPDIIVVEVLEALPGRPITGERLVRPDGKISLGFYGEVYVAGLSITEIKEKILLHLREHINDEILGIAIPDPDKPGEMKPLDNIRDSSRVFVDVVSFNSKVYYVQGDVGVPGRLPITGNETVLDAINYAGGLIPTASSVNIRLVRPAPPGSSKPTLLPVNLAAIINDGDPTTNYQMMPGDRVMVYRDPIVRTTVFLDRLAAPFNSVLNSMLQYSFTARSIKSIDVPINGVAPTTTSGRGSGATNGVLTPATSRNLNNGSQ